MSAPLKNPTDLQLVPETILKKRHNLDELAAKRAAQAIDNPRGNRRVFDSNKKVVKIIKPQKIVMQARNRMNGSRRYERVRKKGMQKRASDKPTTKTEVVPASAVIENDDNEGEETKVTFRSNSVGAGVVFAIRVRPHNGAPKEVKKALSTLRLRSVDEGAFVRYTEANRRMLHLVEPYVVYGPPAASIVSDLLSRRGFGKVDGKRVPLSDNNVVENALGAETGMICVEDLVHELTVAAGDGSAGNFAAAARFLWPFRLAGRASKFQKRKLDFKDGKVYGDLGDEINGIVREML